ncbi:unnamed protein product [Linum tenue]|uniref:Protein ECERIFERUM 1-like n=1 Tax=Linum tenue TaxID=586396 RepID=A0AAV0MNQ8_9ROSI|nr:unnamed protein product [Linum tenue]
MATTPGFLTDWPWKSLGCFKHVLLAPWAIPKTYEFITGNGGGERDLSTFLIFPFLIWRMIHNQLWISFSRYRTAKGTTRIVDRGIEFDQVDREAGWDDQIVFNGLLFYIGAMSLTGATHLPLWRLDGVVITVLLHAGPVEFLYYWLHRALHHHFLYSRYHSHHHSSIATEPITSVIHPFAEHIAYFTLFAIPMLTTILTGTASIVSFAGYITYIDLMNNMGHCNFELVPASLFSAFPPLKLLLYTPTYHSLHHTQFRTNYSLFMPLYDHLYATADESTDDLHERSLNRGDESPDVVHLTHLTTPESVYRLRLGFAYLAASPDAADGRLRLLHRLLWPVTLWTMGLTWLYGRAAFVLERHRFGDVRLQTWALPKYRIQYAMQWQKEAINSLIEDAIVEAEGKGVKVLTLGLLNQASRLRQSFGTTSHANLLLSKAHSTKVWLVGEGLSEEEQKQAGKGTLFIPFSQFPPKKLREDCFYHTTPALTAPKSLENVDSCENWLGRRVMSAWRVAGLVHALEKWEEHECGDRMLDVDKVWEAALRHGFRPLHSSPPSPVVAYN